MSDALEKPDAAAMLERVVITGNLAELKPEERLVYYRELCRSLHLNPLTKPFEFIQLSGRLVLYCTRSGTDQLRKLHGVSITKLEREISEGIYTVTAYAADPTGRTDSSIGAVAIDKLYGEAKSNSYMKAETKAKRRVTLSLCGLGMLDESETEDALAADLQAKQPALSPQTEVTTCAADTALSDEEQERNNNIIAATRLARAMKLSTAELKAYRKTHLDDENADIFNADPAAIKGMVEALREELARRTTVEDAGKV